jgi:hypothetical protein
MVAWVARRPTGLTRLRAFLDQLALHPEQQGSATLRMPPPSGSAVLDALLAGIAEKICDDAGLPRPTWALRVPSLPEPWATPGTPAMREAIPAATPRVLAERGLSIDERSLWREPATVGA